MPLPEIMSGLRIRQMTPFGNMHVKITVDPKTERELEVFAQLGKGGDVANSDLEAICRLISLWLRCGGSLRMAIKQLDGIGSSLTVPTKSGRIVSLGDGLAKGLIRYSKAKEMFGLKNMLLGDFDLAKLDERMRGLTSSGPSPAAAPAKPKVAAMPPAPRRRPQPQPPKLGRLGAATAKVTDMANKRGQRPRRWAGQAATPRRSLPPSLNANGSSTHTGSNARNARAT